MQDIENTQKTVEFVGSIERQVFSNGDNFWVYGMVVSKDDYPEIKQNKYKNVTINGNTGELSLAGIYTVTAIETKDKYGYSYNVVNIKRNTPKTADEMLLFLQEILTVNQAKVLYENYPDIVERVKENRLSDIDLSKLKGIKNYTFNVIVQKIQENFCLADLVIEFQGYLTLAICKKIYAKYKSIEALKTALRKDPYKCLCGLAGIGFKKADAMLLEIEKISKDNISKGKMPIILFDEPLISSKQRCLSCIMYILAENETNGHTKMNLAELRKQCLLVVPECIDSFPDAIASPSISYNKEKMEIALTTTRGVEKYIANKLTTYLKCDEDNPPWDIDVEPYRRVGDFTLSDEQFSVLKTLCENRITILNGSAGCVDCDTEFFNGTEWKPISQYKDGDMVLQYNKDGTAELVKPAYYIKQPAEYLWHFQTKYGLDQCLSDNHNCFYITSKNNLYSKPFKEVRESQEKTGFTGKFITTFDYGGKGINLTDDQIRLMVAIFADGSYYSQYTDMSYKRVRFHLKKQRKKDRIIQLFKNCNLQYRERESVAEGYSDFYIDAPMRCKHFPDEWYQCSKHQLEIIADEVFNWDGNYKEQNRYCTTSKKDADFIQFVLTAIGYRSTITINDRRGRVRTINDKKYITHSVEYVVNKTDRTLITMCSDNRPNYIKTPITPYKTKDGFEYCFTVPSNMLVLRRNDKIFITGNCGKTASTQAIINMLESNGKSYSLFSPTGKAAKVLSEYTNRRASTIHRGLGYQPPNEWLYNQDNPLDVDVVIVDEFSMVDAWLFSKLLCAIDFKRTRLLFIGDNAQLPSVQCGNLLHDFMFSGIIPTVTLTKVFRYGEGGLMKIATDVRMSKPYLDNSFKGKATSFGNGDYMFIDTPAEKVPQNVLKLYKKLIDKGYSVQDIQVLTAKNVGACGTMIMNKYLQKVANPKSQVTTGLTYGKGDTAITYYVGDIVIQTQNNYKAEVVKKDFDWDISYNDFTGKPETAFVANGETGIVKEVTGTHLIIDFGGICVQYSKAELNQINLGYSITIHKSQGSSIKIVILCTPSSDTFMLNSNLIYVGLTRMKEKCFHFGSVQCVNQAVKTKANLTRHTFMSDFLKEFSDKNNQTNTQVNTENS